MYFLEQKVCRLLQLNWDFPGGSDGKASAYNVGDQVPSLGQEDSLEKEMETHSSNLAWKIPWTEDPGSLQFIILANKITN